MAIVNFTVTSTTIGSPWSGSIDLSSNVFTNTVVSSTIPATVTAGGISFSPASVLGVQNYNGVDPANDSTYFTIRGPNNPGGQYPTSGYSLDIWSKTLTDDIAQGNTWAQLINTPNYSLSSAKFTLIYDYTGRYALSWSKGGIITFTTGG